MLPIPNGMERGLKYLFTEADSSTVEIGVTTMKIDANGPIANQIQTERNPSQKPDGIASTGSSEASDRTTLNSTGNSVQLLTNQALQSPEVRQDKVDAIRQSVSSGQYKVDPGKIADAMIAGEDK